MWKPMILDIECIVCNKTLQKIKHDPREASIRMGKITNRRSRTPNWSLDEKQYLLELIKEHKEVVVTKSNNGPNHSEEKDIAWNEILRKLAVKFGTKFSGFSIKKIKTQWQNMKRIAREEITLNGAAVKKYTRQSLEVCGILDLVKEDVLKSKHENDPIICTNVEIKSESFDEDVNQPGCSSVIECITSEDPEKQNEATAILEPSESSTSEIVEMIEDENCEEPQDNINQKKSTFSMTEIPYIEDITNALPLHRELQEFLKYSATEKQLKMESLKEERQVVRAMRETAELNKIIAEQKLKHILWLKKQEMTMYSGEPGSGAGKGGGGGGAIREAGGTFGKMEAAREDEYFYKKQKEQIANIKGHLDKEISFHQEQIKRHEDAIRRHKEQMAEMNSNK